MFSTRIKLDKAVYERVAAAAERAGYASIEEFVNHVLERAVDDVEEGASDDHEVEKQLRGLGYIE